MSKIWNIHDPTRGLQILDTRMGFPRPSLNVVLDSINLKPVVSNNHVEDSFAWVNLFWRHKSYIEVTSEITIAGANMGFVMEIE